LPKSFHIRKTAPILGGFEAEVGMGSWETDWSRDALERIVALLFALANLADLAAGAPFLRRRQVLAILNHGEVVARAFVIGMATGAPISSDELESSGDAACLAVRLRALALMLCAMLAGALFAPPGVVGPRACRPSHKAGKAGRSTASPLAFDTS
jgi:hypothetical protein